MKTIEVHGPIIMRMFLEQPRKLWVSNSRNMFLQKEYRRRPPTIRRRPPPLQVEQKFISHKK